MIGLISFGRLIWRARALRFLLLCLSCWTGARMVSQWPAVPGAPMTMPPLQAAAPTSFRPIYAAMTSAAPERVKSWAVRDYFEGRLRRAASQSGSNVAGDGAVPLVGAPESWAVNNRHALRLALLQRLLPASAGFTARTAWIGNTEGRQPVPGLGAPGVGTGGIAATAPFSSRKGWAGGAWFFVRSGGAVPDNPLPLAQIGGNQAGVRVAYGFGESGRVRAYVRATVTPSSGGQREAALGIAFAPMPGIPMDVQVEHRLAPQGRGRNALALLASGGVSDMELPAGFRLDAYAQAGVVGVRHPAPFGDAAASVERELASHHGRSLAAGIMAAAAAQPGAARLDVGPRISLRLPDIGKGSRLALDWRQRVAGEARPASGLALTLAADF